MVNRQFNIRVYGILINYKKEVLLSDELRNGMAFTKFPGGGLEFGEGTIECLKREFQEELEINIEVKELFYCTDFYIHSAWNKNDQLLSIYYFVDYNLKNELKFAEYLFPLEKEGEYFKWISISEIQESDVTFPIDKLVVKKLIEKR